MSRDRPVRDGGGLLEVADALRLSRKPRLHHDLRLRAELFFDELERRLTIAEAAALHVVRVVHEPETGSGLRERKRSGRLQPSEVDPL